MESRLVVVTDRDLTWPHSRTMPSHDGVWSGKILPSPSPTESAWNDAILPRSLQTGQLSPVSSGIDTIIDSSSGPTTAHSTSSSCADSWSTGHVDKEDGYQTAQWDNWGGSQDELMTAPKEEPVDDDNTLNELTNAPLTPTQRTVSPNSSEIKKKRPRGRPRKHPLTQTASTGKITKGRSKTGCITCRKRKKKCDEAKPRCLNCEKNAVVCEGYHEKQIWKSGKERAEEERLQQEHQPLITMQPIFHGVETAEDMILWRHYITHLSNVLTVEGEAKNGFKDIILQLANQHQGLMHSILAVSFKHIDFDSPYGFNLLQDNHTMRREVLQQRGEHHHEEALKRLYKDMENPVDREHPSYDTVLAAQYGQILCLLLQTKAEGNPRGEHRVHLRAYQALIEQSPPQNNTFYTFVYEFFRYHIYADDLLWHSGPISNRLSSEKWESDLPLHQPRLIGVGDGLFHCLARITSLRHTIRANIASGVDPAVDYTSLYRAAEIDAVIREWAPVWPRGDSRNRVGPLYKQAMWVYLFKTIYPPASTPQPPSACTAVPTNSAEAKVTNLQRSASMVASVDFATKRAASPLKVDLSAPKTAHSCPSSRNPSRTSSIHEHIASAQQPAAASPHLEQSTPPPARKPPQDDGRITIAVEESLVILESFNASDPAQTLLLVPSIIIGTACFEESQRNRLQVAIKVIRGYTGLRNCDRAIDLLEEVWSLMDQGDWTAVWDWQSVATRLGLDFVCA